MLEPQLPDDAPPSRAECIQAMISHALGVTAGFLAPLFIWRTAGQHSAYVAQHAKEGLNLQILLGALLLAGWNFAPEEWFPLLMSFYFMINTIATVPASIAAAQGRPYRHRLPLRLID